MYDKVQSKVEDSGVSPVIGVILMVAVTVALVALVTVIVFDIGGDVSESPDATVDLAQEGTNVTATVLRNENVDSFKVRSASAYTSSNSDLSTGDTYNYGTGGSAIKWADNWQTKLELSDVGDSTNVPNEIYDTSDNNDAALSDGEQIQVIAVMSDGSEQVLTTTEYEA